MEFNRNYVFMVGIVLLFLGFQLRRVESVVLNDRCSKLLGSAAQASQAESSGFARVFKAAGGPAPKKVVRPPNWIGYCFMSVGAVLVLQSLVMKKPGG